MRLRSLEADKRLDSFVAMGLPQRQSTCKVTGCLEAQQVQGAREEMRWTVNDSQLQHRMQRLLTQESVSIGDALGIIFPTDERRHDGAHGQQVHPHTNF